MSFTMKQFVYALLFVYFILAFFLNDVELVVGMTVVVMVLLWVTEVMPLWLTALLPFVVWPISGVYGDGFWLNTGKTIDAFLNPYLALFFGGMAIGGAMEQTQLHRRVALGIMCRTGTSVAGILVGLLIAVALLSAFISNTAASVMLLVIACALAKQLRLAKGSSFAAAIMLSIAYGANVGGITTFVGTPPNGIYVGHLAEQHDRVVGFGEFILFGTPFVLLFLLQVFAVLYWIAMRDEKAPDVPRRFLFDERAKLGSIDRGETIVAVIFCLVVLCWLMSRPLYDTVAPLVGSWLKGSHVDATIGLLGAAAVLSTRTLSFAGLQRLSWGTLALMGGSFALASGVVASGLSQTLMTYLIGINGWQLGTQLLAVSGLSVGLSSVASNTATMGVLVSVLPQQIPLLAAAMIGVSCNFMLPAGTPPNAVVFSSGYVQMRTMVLVGFVLNVLAVLNITMYVLVRQLLWPL